MSDFELLLPGFFELLVSKKSEAAAAGHAAPGVFIEFATHPLHPPYRQ
jgi:hypothetical protein